MNVLWGLFVMASLAVTTTHVKAAVTPAPATLAQLLGWGTWGSWSAGFSALKTTCPAPPEITPKPGLAGAQSRCTVLTFADFSRRPVLFVVGLRAAPSANAEIHSVSVNIYSRDPSEIFALRGQLEMLLGPSSSQTTGVTRWQRCGRTIEAEELAVGGLEVRALVGKTVPRECELLPRNVERSEIPLT